MRDVMRDVISHWLEAPIWVKRTKSQSKPWKKEKRWCIEKKIYFCM